MLTAHQRMQLRRVGLRVGDELPSTFVVVLDHPTTAIATQIGSCGGSATRDDIPAIMLPFVAFRARRSLWMDIVKIDADKSRIDPEVEWTVTPLVGEPDADGVQYVPQLDARGEEALEFLRAFVAGLEETPE